MRAEGIEVRPDRLDIGTRMCDGLRSIDEDEGTSFVCQARDFSYGIDRTKDVADVGDGDKARTLTEQGAVGIHIDLTYGRQGDDTQMRPTALAHHLPRHDIRVVLHRADDDLVASRDEGFASRRCDEIDGLRSAAGEDKTFG